MNPTEDIFQTHAVKFVKPFPNRAEMFHFTSAKYEDLVLENEQNDWIVFAKRKQKSKQTEELVTAKQEGKLKPPPYKLKPPPYNLKQPPSTPKNMEDSKYAWENKTLSTYKCCGMTGHTARDFYARTFGTRIQWRQFPYPKPGDKPLTRKERQRLQRLEDKFEEKDLEISLGLQAYYLNFPPPDPVILLPELHVLPSPVCDKFGHKAADCPELCPLCIKTGDCNDIMA
jgi:hypothetical protein